MSHVQKKIVVRRLPPTLNSETFLEQTSPLGNYSYYYYVTGESCELPFSRAYIQFVKHEDVVIFQEKFDGYIFIDDRGNEYPAQVEYAPFGKVPKMKVKLDPKSGSIEQDQDYLKFLENLGNCEQDASVTPEAILEEFEARDKSRKANNGSVKVATPLIDFLTKKKEEKRQVQVMKAKQREEERKKRQALKEYNKREKYYDDSTPSSKRDENTAEGDKEYVSSKHSIRSIKGAAMKSKNSEGFKSKEDAHKSRNVYESQKKAREPDPHKKGKSRYSSLREKTEEEKCDQKEEGSSDVHPRKQCRAKHDNRTQSTGETENCQAIPSETSPVQQKDHEPRSGESRIDNEHKIEKTEKREKKADGAQDRNSDSKQRIRYKDRPERAIYRPGQKKEKPSETGHA